MQAPVELLLHIIRIDTDRTGLDSLPQETLSTIDHWLTRVRGEVAQRLELWELNCGDRVIVRLDDGNEITTTARSRPFMLNSHSPVIFLDGFAGCYALWRVRRAA